MSRFRSELVRRGLSEPLPTELNRQLDARGLVVKTGTLIDASLIEADGRRPRQGEPVEGRSDRDASWNAMPETPLFGYKAHLAVDQSSGLVRQALLTPAHVSDKTPFLALVQGDERTFAILKRWYGYRRVRYRSLGRNALQLQLLALALNLRRALALTC